MKPSLSMIPIIAVGVISMSLSQPGFAAAGLSEIRITLFGQPCALQGPFEPKILQEIHSMSPEQVYPDTPGRNANLDQSKRALEKVKNLKSLPQSLSVYRDRLIRRLDAQTAFFTALASYRKDRKTSPILAAGQHFAQPHRRKAFELSVKNLEEHPQSFEMASTELLNAFNEGIEPNPEEEFHRAIRRLKVQYRCTFEEDDQENNEESNE